ncbi:MAG: uroporphyrinogen-III C-methyltransferase [Cellvibrionales bacterium]|nr:uroporphyrinogen-III C-methyltransferase [Cellvibrionales bacterium]
MKKNNKKAPRQASRLIHSTSIISEGAMQSHQASGVYSIDAMPVFRRKQAGVATWLIFLLILVIVGALSGGFYLYQKMQKELHLLDQYVTKIEKDAQQRTESVNTFQRKLSQISAETKSQDMVLNDHLKELQSQLNKMNGDFERISDATVSNQSWLLSEAEYLLKTADHRILMKEDVAGAIKILQSADNLLKQMPLGDQGLLNVRVAIAKDIASLQALKSVDVLGTYAQLTALGDQIERLPLVPTEMPESKSDDDQGKKSTQPKMLAKINETLGGYLSIKRHDTQALSALLSEESGQALKASFRLIIEQAQTALLQGNQIIYDESLAKLRSRVHQYFVAGNFKVNLVIKKIDELLKIKVKNDLPDISGSQQALKRYLSERSTNQ